MNTKEFIDGVIEGLSIFSERRLPPKLRRIERKIAARGYTMKRRLFLSTLELFLLLCGVAFFLVGGILIFNRFLPLELILLVVGLILVNIVLLAGRFR